MNNCFMRMIVFFDLPVETKKSRREATQFRNFLLKDGYSMLQFSIYARICNGLKAVEKHESRLNNYLPNKGSIRLLVVTEKQYASMKILLGSKTEYDNDVANWQISFF
jgi:CRISPR-associated protein Cas2